MYFYSKVLIQYASQLAILVLKCAVNKVSDEFVAPDLVTNIFNINNHCRKILVRNMNDAKNFVTSSIKFRDFLSKNLNGEF